jgi:hypothetical protein
MVSYSASAGLSGMVSPSVSNSKGLSTIHGSDDSKDRCAIVEIKLTIMMCCVLGGRGVGKVADI